MGKIRDESLSNEFSKIGRPSFGTVWPSPLFPARYAQSVESDYRQMHSLILFENRS